MGKIGCTQLLRRYIGIARALQQLIMFVVVGTAIFFVVLGVGYGYEHVYRYIRFSRNRILCAIPKNRRDD